MRPLRPGRKNIVALVVLVLGALATWISRRDADDSQPPRAEPAGERRDTRPAVEAAPPRETAPPKAATPHAGRAADFDFYLLALTLHPAFCADGHSREPECRTGAPVMLSIHGLWPEEDQPGRYPRDCKGPRLDLEPSLEDELRPLMPGIADGLHEHEWRKHGTCSGLDDDEYFRHTLALARRVDTALRAKLTTLAGGETTAAELRDYAEQFDPGLAGTLTFHCRTLRNAPAGNRQAYLVEIRQCVDDDGEARAPRTPLQCARVQRRDQGCGRAFLIAEPARS